jgi:hypothetical protein
MLTTLRRSIFVLVVLASVADAQARRVELNDLGREVTLSGPRLSPDGTQAAGHFPPDPVHQRDVRRRWIDWISRQFGGPI